jgi:hypothetical protein
LTIHLTADDDDAQHGGPGTPGNPTLLTSLSDLDRAADDLMDSISAEPVPDRITELARTLARSLASGDNTPPH